MVKALFPIGKTQWAKWGDAAREAYNDMRKLGYTHETGVAEANAVQAKVRKAALEELTELGQKQDAPLPTPVKPAPAPKKPAVKRAAPTKKAK